MSNTARYAIAADGAVRHWLAAPTHTEPLTDLDAIIAPSGSPFGDAGRWTMNFWAWHPDVKALKRRIYAALPDAPTPQPDTSWRYVRADEDAAIDFSRFSFTPTRFSGALYAEIVAPGAMTLDAHLLTIGPARLWLNGEPAITYTEPFSYVDTIRAPGTLALREGVNTVLILGEMIGLREARLALGLRLLNAPDGLQVQVPIGDIAPDDWHTAQAGLDALYLTRYAFPGQTIPVHYADEAPAPFTFEAAIRLPYVEGTPHAQTFTVQPGETVELTVPETLLRSMAHLPVESGMILDLRPVADVPLHTEYEVFLTLAAYSHAPYGTYESRRAEALAHLATMRADMMGAIAAVETGAADTLNNEAIDRACTIMENRHDCADFFAVSLLVALYKYANTPHLRPEHQARIEAAFRGFKYAIEEPGLDAMCYFTENHQILFYTTEYLAAQYWADWTFDNDGQPASAKRAHARGRILNWVGRRLRGNFSEWDSNAYLALDIFALLALVEYADDAAITTAARTLLDKIFFITAMQSYRGTHGGTHGRCYVASLKSGRVENTSGVQRIAFGLGMFNGETRATGMLALSTAYTVPSLIQYIGSDVQRTLTTRARSVGAFVPEMDMVEGGWDVSTVTYRSPHVMLAAAVDHRPGEFGIQEHLWQATLSPEAVVFTTYPGNMQEHGFARPNYWAGSARLPHVGMHRRAVVCLYQYDDTVGMGFTHAYFPTAAFDEWRIDGAYAFARHGGGYVALWANGPLSLVTRGRHAMQELRTKGTGEAWVCLVGDSDNDGSFDDFCETVMRRTPAYDASTHTLRVETITGEKLALTWGQAFTVDGIAQSVEDFPHYANAYTQTALDDRQMVLNHNGQSLTLDLSPDSIDMETSS